MLVQAKKELGSFSKAVELALRPGREAADVWWDLQPLLTNYRTQDRVATGSRVITVVKHHLRSQTSRDEVLRHILEWVRSLLAYSRFCVLLSKWLTHQPTCKPKDHPNRQQSAPQVRKAQSGVSWQFGSVSPDQKVSCVQLKLCLCRCGRGKSKIAETSTVRCRTCDTL